MTIRFALLFMGLLLCLPGCGDGGPDLDEVSGTVTLDGRPMPNVMLTFVPQTPGGSPSYGRTDAEGSYTLMFTRDKSGAMLGKHHVRLESEQISASEAADLKAEGLEVPAYVPIPKKYNEPGALDAEVKPGSNVIDFPLTSGE